MAKKRNCDLSDKMSTLYLDGACSKDFSLDDDIQTQLDKLKSNFESIFSWDIRLRTGNKNYLLLDHIEKYKDICENFNDSFNLKKISLQLIIVYELYMYKSYKESLLEIENIIKSLESYECDEELMQYFDAYKHIALSTNAYIALTLNLNCEKMIKDIKPVNNLNPIEKSAIFAVKARIFMEYPSNGNYIALKFADEARNLCSESEWISVWLRAKGRVRRHYNRNEIPGENEINAVDILCTANCKPHFLFRASRLNKELALAYKSRNNQEQSDIYKKRSSDFILKFIELSEDNVHNNIRLLNSFLSNYFGHLKKLQLKAHIDKIVLNLENVNNNVSVDKVLGRYYSKYKKNYVKAKMYLSRGMNSGNFSCSLELVKLECLLQPVNEFPFLQTLNTMYDVFLSPSRRLIILSHILTYCYYYENNPNELMHYLKLYIDQNIDDSVKKHHLISISPMFKLINATIVKNTFLYALVDKVKNVLIHHDWTEDEKEIHHDTFDRFYKMLQMKIPGSQFQCDDKTVCKQSCGKSSTPQYPINKPYNDRNSDDCKNWRKQCNEGLDFRKNNECDWRKQRINTSKK